MKLYYPYFNLFRSVSTKKYALETVIKIPKGKDIGDITQSFDGEFYNVTIPVIGGNGSDKENTSMVFERIKLTPNDEKELKKIKILVTTNGTSADLATASADTSRDGGTTGGEGLTGGEDAEEERP